MTRARFHRDAATLSALAALLVAAAFAAPAAADGGEPVTFVNVSGEEQYLLVRYGPEKECDEKSGEEKFRLAPDAERQLDIGGEKACWCSSTFGQVGDCGEYWNKAKPGGRERVR